MQLRLETARAASTQNLVGGGRLEVLSLKEDRDAEGEGEAYGFLKGCTCSFADELFVVGFDVVVPCWNELLSWG